MDIKWKNNRIIRSIIVIMVLTAVVGGNLYLFPRMVQQVKALREEKKQEGVSADALSDYMIDLLYYGTHVLYDEAILSENNNASVTDVSAGETRIAIGEGEEVAYEMTEEEAHYSYRKQDYINTFYYNNSLEYCVLRPNEDGEYVLGNWNGNRDLIAQLSQLQYEKDGSQVEQSVQEKYDFYILLSFDEKGRMSITKAFDKHFSNAIITDAFFEAENSVRIENKQNSNISYPQNTKIIFAMTEENYSLANYDWWYSEGIYFEINAVILPIISIFVMAALALLLGNPKRKEGKRESLISSYPLIPIVLGATLCIQSISEFPYWMTGYELTIENLRIYQNDTYLLGFVLSKEMLEIITYIGFAILLGCVYLSAYYVMALIRPIFSMGIIAYLKEKSILIKLISTLGRYLKKWKEEIEQVHMEEPKKKKLFRVLLFNFIVLSILSCFWFFAIPLLVLYSIALHIYLQKCYAKVEKDYMTMAEAAEQIAQGHLEYKMEESMGIYEPMREKLGRVQEGMKKAVREEVKSQRMKTELISNVSHDLKTPLTAITTYVELLKNPDLTEEERIAYIDTLEKKSFRLKTLIEDLFEVSKTASHDIVLNKEEVDIVHLLRQASVEQQEKWEAAGLVIRFQVPEERVMLSLDGQKTYRIFDNLFGNISKYALPNTRVYVDVTANENTVEVVLRNISAVELNVAPEEITERFVRGDESRNTEGTGLGLAIAKNLVEAQDGTMKIALDGDLFKVTILWRR